MLSGLPKILSTWFACSLLPTICFWIAYVFSVPGFLYSTCLWDVASGGVNAIFSDREVELRHVFMMVAKLCISMLQRGTHLLKFWFLSVLLFEMELGNGGEGGGGGGADVVL